MNWNNPTITTSYDIFLAELKARDIDAMTMGFSGMPSITNPPAGALIFQREGYSRFVEFNGTSWTAKLIGILGGGTNADNPASARTNLGIGTMGVQNSNAVAIGGGTIFGISQLDIATPIYFMNDGVYDIGSPSGAVRNLFIRHGLVLPVGVNKYVVA